MAVELETLPVAQTSKLEIRLLSKCRGSCNEITSHGFLLICGMPGHWLYVFTASRSMWLVDPCGFALPSDDKRQGSNTATGGGGGGGRGGFGWRKIKWAAHFLPPADSRWATDPTLSPTCECVTLQKQNVEEYCDQLTKNWSQSRFKLSLSAVNKCSSSGNIKRHFQCMNQRMTVCLSDR